MEPMPITVLKGVGEKTAALYQKLGIKTVEDLLHAYPRAYDSFLKPQPISELKPDTVAAVEAILPKTADVLRYGTLQVTVLSLREKEAKLNLIWYNMPYLRGTLRAGEHFVFRGHLVRKKGILTMEQPEWYRPEVYEKLISSMQPVYAQTKGLGNKSITKSVANALAIQKPEPEYLPEKLLETYQLVGRDFALEQIHFPVNEEARLAARTRLVFEEFFLFLLSVRLLKGQKEKQKSAYSFVLRKEVQEVKERLPYALTKAQERVLQEVNADLSGGHTMNRLIQGDVGSGKTVIAILALLQAAYNGFQGALMVPTEVLAAQHYESLCGLLEAQQLPVRPLLLTGSMTAKEKRLAYEKIERHEADLIIGTHALIQEKVIFEKLALVIIDEQHRFGVGQRALLGSKGKEPHVLVMSATPIPRTLALILYGDLDISVIDELPANRKPIKNCVVGKEYRDNAYRFIEKEVRAGRQAYVICPMVEAGELLDAENVMDYTKTLRQVLPKEIRVEFLHGRMKPKEKNQRMEEFADGAIQVLVSTTVIEVGINVPNAVVMLIENAERFGLAQLHQLRGRVGRGQEQSYCIMVNASGEEDAQKRLEILNQSNDGFFIASEDLKLRGPGDLFGIRQSGDLEFKLADIFADAALLTSISEEVNQLLQEDPLLAQKEHERLRQKLEQYRKQTEETIQL